MEFQYETVLVERNDGVTKVILNRPAKRNAMNPTMHREMRDVLLKLEVDRETKVVVITGAGPSFCAGQDLKEFFKDTADDEAQRMANNRIADDWRVRILRMFPKPTIAMINGYCFGGAFTMVVSCDFAIAADTAVFGLSEVNWGAIPGGIVSKAIGSQMMFRDALYHAMTGETFDGRQASSMRFINRSVPAGQLEANVMELARKLAGMDAHALRATKQAFKQAVELNWEQAYWWLTAKSAELRLNQSREGSAMTGIDKFLAKDYRPGLQSHTDAPDARAETPVDAVEPG